MTVDIFYVGFTILIFNFQDGLAVPHEYCLGPLNRSDCGLAATPVISYYKPGSRCEIEFWRGCPTVNKFNDEFLCSHFCIGKLFGFSLSEDVNKIDIIVDRCSKPLDKGDCGSKPTTVYTYDGHCKPAEWRGCNSINIFYNYSACVSSCEPSFDEWKDQIKLLDPEAMEELDNLLEDLVETVEEEIAEESAEEEVTEESSEEEVDEESAEKEVAETPPEEEVAEVSAEEEIAEESVEEEVAEASAEEEVAEEGVAEEVIAEEAVVEEEVNQEPAAEEVKEEAAEIETTTERQKLSLNVHPGEIGDEAVTTAAAIELTKATAEVVTQAAAEVTAVTEAVKEVTAVTEAVKEVVTESPSTEATVTKASESGSDSGEAKEVITT